MGNEKPFKLKMSFDQALRRFAKVGKHDVAESLIENYDRIGKDNRDLEEKVKKDIERGARSRKPKFRL